MAEEEDPQYLIEIQDGNEGSSQDEVMVILDLDGQDMPDSVTQAIIHLAQNSKQPISSVRVTKAHKKQTIEMKPKSENEFCNDEGNFQSLNLKGGADEVHYGILSSNEENFSESTFLTGEANIHNDMLSSNSDFPNLMREDQGIFQNHVSPDNQTNGQGAALRDQQSASELVKSSEEDLNDKFKTVFETCTGGLNPSTRIVVKDLIQLEEFRTGKVRQSICSLNNSSPSEMNVYLEVKPKDNVTCSNETDLLPDAQNVLNYDEKPDLGEQNDFSCPSNKAVNVESKYNQLKDSVKARQTKRLTSGSFDDEMIPKNKHDSHERTVECTNINGSDKASCEKPIYTTHNQNEIIQRKFDAVNNVSLVKDISNISCSFCSFQCQSDLEMGRHLKVIHKDQHPFKCSICNKSFALELSFKIHNLSHSDGVSEKRIKANKFIDCPHCSQSFTTTRRVLRHVSKAHEKLEVFFCNSCKMSFKSKSELNKHLLSSSHLEKVNKLTVCPICHISCVRLSKHLTIKHPTYCPFLCDLCGYSCKIYAKLKTHLLFHVSEKPYQCPHCHKYLKSKVSWSRHVKNHNSERKFSCDQCKFRSNDSYEYKCHVQRVHSKNQYYDCKFCNLSFLKALDLKLHAMSEHKSKDTQFCSYCNFSCETRAEMKKHRQIHTGEHPYVCDQCGFSTAYKAHLERHISTHSDLKPFKCPECDYSCKEKVNLNKHMVIHRPEKPFACSMCPHRCKLRSLLNSHIRIVHSSLRPYSCPQCDYTCKTVSNLKKHQWVHQGYKPFACRFCPYVTCETNKLRKHENFKHKAEIGAELSNQEKKIPQIKEEVTNSFKHTVEAAEGQQEGSTFSKEMPELVGTGFTKGLFRLSNALDSVAEEDMGPVVEKTFISNGRVSLARLQETTQGDSFAFSTHPPQTQRFIIQYSE